MRLQILLLATALLIVDVAFADAIRQINHVNVATGDVVRSLTFSEDDEWLTLHLE